MHYVSRGSADGVFPKTCRAAVITEVDPMAERRNQIRPVVAESFGIDPDLLGQEDPAVSLCVLNPSGIFFQEDCEYDPGQPVEGWAGAHTADYAPGTWHWPERVE